MNYTLHDLPAEERPRERLRSRGVDNLSSQELLALIIEKGRPGLNALTLAQSLLVKFESLRGVKEASLEELKKIKGIGFATACKIKSAFEIGERVQKVSERYGQKIGEPKDVFNLLRKNIGGKKKEHFVVLCLDSRSKLITINSVSVGTINASLAHPREIFRPAVKSSAASIILAHNHPSGNPEPGENDIKITEKLQKAGEMMGIGVKDHIVVCSDNFFSLKKEDLI